MIAAIIAIIIGVLLHILDQSGEEGDVGAVNGNL